jgi:hypothetical protein
VIVADFNEFLAPTVLAKPRESRNWSSGFTHVDSDSLTHWLTDNSTLSLTVSLHPREID